MSHSRFGLLSFIWLMDATLPWSTFQNNSREARIQVQISHDTAVLAFWFETD
ncbi:MAG: hypothetical protein HY360_19790 [Verrucomicrobia bacterium]|nr:hypothetical protein [Verrucomicrobiota bacterium]